MRGILLAATAMFVAVAPALAREHHRHSRVHYARHTRHPRPAPRDVAQAPRPRQRVHSGEAATHAGGPANSTGAPCALDLAAIHKALVGVGPDHPYRIAGLLDIAGAAFRFVSGGAGRGSIPYGDYLITTDRDELGGWGKRHGAYGLAHNDGIYDPKIGRTREGIEMHESHGSRSAGCIAIEGWDRAKHAISSLIGDAGHAFLHVWPGRYSVTADRIDGPETLVAKASEDIEEEADDGEQHHSRRHKTRIAHRVTRHHHYAHHEHGRRYAKA